MNKSMLIKWLGGVAGLVVLYLFVIWFGYHRKAISSIPPATPQPDGATLTVDLGGGLPLDFVRIPAGKFMMGSPDGEDSRDSSEGPQHEVTIARPFYLGQFVVTQDQWSRLMKNQSDFKGSGNLPAEQVSWDDCQKFCQAVSKMAGRPIRLPTEAEWEYACRAGTTTAFSFGESISSTQANFDGGEPYLSSPAGPKRDKTTPVGSFKANSFGLYDMHGNVSQWCQDVFHPDYSGAPTDGSAWELGGPDAAMRVYRGGAWRNDAASCRSAVRYAGEQHGLRTNVLGFRVAADLLPQP